jgi:hypothetical protein
MFVCMVAISDWMRSNRLSLNASITDFIWFVTVRCQHQLPANHFYVGNEFILPASSVGNLGLPLDSEISMINHIAKVTTACFGALQ